MLDGQPEGASDAELCEAVREAEDYELEFVLPAVPVTEAEAAAAAAAGEGQIDVWGEEKDERGSERPGCFALA